MSSRPYHGPVLSKKEELLCHRIQDHVRILAGDIGERNLWKEKALEASAHYIEKVWMGFGYQVTRQVFEIQGKTVANIETEKRGISRPEEIVVMGAHYDSIMGSPGANDNASGVAALLEMARLLAQENLARSLRFVAFVNEEPPFFQTENMGSRVYASRSRQKGERIVAMFSLETIGYYSDEPRSQKYPFPFQFFYPNTANFIGFVGNISSWRLVGRALTTFRKHTAFPAKGVAAPAWITGIGWSDHWAFWQEGYPAVMITDTALFRYPYYHTSEDTPDKLDYARMARVVTGISRMIAAFAGTDQGS